MSDPTAPDRLGRLMRTQGLLTPEERTTFLERFCAINYHWRGAHVADVLDTLESTDAHLDLIEPVYAAASDTEADLARERGTTLGLLIYAAHYAFGDHQRWRELLDRAAEPPP